MTDGFWKTTQRAWDMLRRQSNFFFGWTNLKQNLLLHCSKHLHPRQINPSWIGQRIEIYIHTIQEMSIQSRKLWFSLFLINNWVFDFATSFIVWMDILRESIFISSCLSEYSSMGETWISINVIYLVNI